MAAELAPSKYDAYLDQAARREQRVLLELEARVHNHLIQSTDLQVLLRLGERELLERIRSMTNEISQETQRVESLRGGRARRDALRIQRGGTHRGGPAIVKLPLALLPGAEILAHPTGSRRWRR